MLKDTSYFKKTFLTPSKVSFSFDTLSDYLRFTNEVEKIATGNAKKGIDSINAPKFVSGQAKNKSWYGTTDVNRIKEDLVDYLFSDKLENFVNSLKAKTIQLDVTDIDQKKKIKFTEQEVGVFSFDLASLGLIPVYEFYSPVLNSVVSGNLVISEKNAQGKTLFFFVGTPEIKEHIVKYNPKEGGYFSNILKRVVSKTELIETENLEYVYPAKEKVEKHLVERRNKLDEKGNKKFTTTFKKCFIEMPKVNKLLPRIDLIVGAGFRGDVDAETEMIYSALTAIALAEKLSKSNVEYRIIASFSFNTIGSGAEKQVHPFIILKKEGEVLDKNKIAMILSDGRFNRYKRFKANLAMQFEAGFDKNINPDSISSSIYNDTIIKNAYLETLANSDNPLDRKKAEEVNSKIVISGIFNERQAIDKYNAIIQQISKI